MRHARVPYEAIELHPHGYTSHSNGFWLLICALALRLDGRKHHEGAIAREDIRYQAIMCVCVSLC